MRNLTHPIPAEWLTALYDGELDGARREQMEAHLRDCAECQRELEAWGAVSHALAMSSLPEPATGAAPASVQDFSSRVLAQLPERQPGPARVSGVRLLLRWAPGIGLLVLNAALQVIAVAGIALMLLPGRVWALLEWPAWVYGLVSGSGLGWLTWVLPGGWSGLGLLLSGLALSGALAVLYLAWLGYEWLYGASGQWRWVFAEKGV